MMLLVLSVKFLLDSEQNAVFLGIQVLPVDFIFLQKKYPTTIEDHIASHMKLTEAIANVHYHQYRKFANRLSQPCHRHHFFSHLLQFDILLNHPELGA